METGPRRVPAGVSEVAVELAAAGGAGVAESLALLDGGRQAYPRMLAALRAARRSVHLEVYAFAATGVGAEFVEALAGAARRGVAVRVVLDGLGSARGGLGIAEALRQAGCQVRIYHRLLALLVGRFGRNHRKVLLIDDEVAFLGGLNIGDENLDGAGRPGWADLALEIRGASCVGLRAMLHHRPRRAATGAIRISMCGLGGGWRLRRRYVRAFVEAKSRIQVAHGYFLPDRGIARALASAARRGVEVRLLLAGQSDVPFAHAATRSRLRRLLAAGVQIREWNESVLHAKVATVDGRRLLLGSFNLDPLSLANQEALVEVSEPGLVAQGEAWIADHFARATPVTSLEEGPALLRWLLDLPGRLAAWLAEATSRLAMARRAGAWRRRATRAATRSRGEPR